MESDLNDGSKELIYKGRKGGEYKLSGSGETDLLIRCMAPKQEDPSVDLRVHVKHLSW